MRLVEPPLDAGARLHPGRLDEAEGRGVDHLEVLLDGLLVGDALELAGVGVGPRVGVVDPVDAVLGHEHRVALDLQGALGAHRVGREEGHAGARTEDDDATLLEVADRATRDVGLGDLAHRDGGLDASVNASFLAEIL